MGIFGNWEENMWGTSSPKSEINNIQPHFLIWIFDAIRCTIIDTISYYCGQTGCIFSFYLGLKLICCLFVFQVLLPELPGFPQMPEGEGKGLWALPVVQPGVQLHVPRQLDREVGRAARQWKLPRQDLNWKTKIIIVSSLLIITTAMVKYVWKLIYFIFLWWELLRDGMLIDL